MAVPVTVIFRTLAFIYISFGGTSDWANAIVDKTLYRLDLTTLMWTAEQAPSTPEYDTLISFPYFALGVWGLSVTTFGARDDPSSGYLQFFGGKSGDGWIDNVVLYDITARTWTVVPQGSLVNDPAVELGQLIPTGRRSHSAVNLPRGVEEEALAVVFGIPIEMNSLVTRF